MSAPWSWRLDTRSGATSTLGPSASVASASLNPLSSLSHASTGASAAADDIFWQDFRAVPSKLSRSERKRARLHRFDSDEDVHSEAIKLEREDGEATPETAVESDDDATVLGGTSSDESATGEDKDGATEGATSTTPPSPIRNIKREKTPPTIKRKLSRADAATSSTHLIAQTIHRHALADPDDAPPLPIRTHDPPPPPLTYKETLRLVRLIAMIFRFPKSSRRTMRRRDRSSHDDSTASTSPDTTLAASSSSTASTLPDTSTPSSSASDGIQLKPKSSLSTNTATSSSSSTPRKPRILAHVHPADAHPSSDAVLKLIALVPAALPARVGCADWIAALAVGAMRDEYGNILLPSSAYVREPGESRRGGSAELGGGGAVKLESAGGGVGKVTRSTRARWGREAPAIPLPGFWRKRGAVVVEKDGAVRVETEDAESSVSVDNNEASVDEVATASSDVSRSQSPHPPSTPETQPWGKRRAVNLSKLLAERMREKRHAKLLLLRTHQSLRKRPRSNDQEGGRHGDVAERAAGEEEEEGFDAETMANTLANSATALPTFKIGQATQQSEQAGAEVDNSTLQTQDDGPSTTIKHEEP